MYIHMYTYIHIYIYTHISSPSACWWWDFNPINSPQIDVYHQFKNKSILHLCHDEWTLFPLVSSWRVRHPLNSKKHFNVLFSDLAKSEVVRKDSYGNFRVDLNVGPDDNLEQTKSQPKHRLQNTTHCSVLHCVDLVLISDLKIRQSHKPNRYWQKYACSESCQTYACHTYERSGPHFGSEDNTKSHTIQKFAQVCG